MQGPHPWSRFIDMTLIGILLAAAAAAATVAETGCGAAIAAPGGPP
jgi:hypothetical protein